LEVDSIGATTVLSTFILPSVEQPRKKSMKVDIT
jgi:hypothetical protein